MASNIKFNRLILFKCLFFLKLGGLCVSTGLHKLGQMMDSKLLLNDMKELKLIFNHITTNICEFNDICKRMIEDCFNENDEVKLAEKKKSLKKK